MSESTKLFNWITLLLCVLLFAAAGVASMVVAIIFSSAVPGLSIICFGFEVGFLGCAFFSMRAMENFV